MSDSVWESHINILHIPVMRMYLSLTFSVLLLLISSSFPPLPWPYEYLYCFVERKRWLNIVTQRVALPSGPQRTAPLLLCGPPNFSSSTFFLIILSVFPKCVFSKYLICFRQCFWVKGASLVAQTIKLASSAGDLGLTLASGMRMGMATHSSILAWRIHGQRSLALQSMGLQRVGHD